MVISLLIRQKYSWRVNFEPPTWKDDEKYKECAEAKSCALCCDEKVDECTKECEDENKELVKECEEKFNHCLEGCDYFENQDQIDRCIFGCLGQKDDCLKPFSRCGILCDAYAEQYCRCNICGFDCNPIPPSY